MRHIDKALQAGYAAFKSGAFADARRHLRRIEHPKAIHLLGLVEKADGNFEKALQLMQRAAAKDPLDPEIANNLARTARDSGQLELAEYEFRRAVTIRPDFQQPAMGLGQLLLDLERYQQALDVYENLLSIAPTDIFVRHGLGTALLGIGQTEDAESVFNSLLREGNKEPQIRFMRARCRLELGQTMSALEDLKISHAASPSIHTLRVLANTYWMMRKNTEFDALLDEALALPALNVAAAEILRQSGAPLRALSALKSGRGKFALPPESWSVAATAHIDLNEARQAEEAAREGLAAAPGDPLCKRNLVVSLLMQGKAMIADPIIEEMRRAEPNDQQWLAYELTSLRLLGSECYTRIVDLDRFVRTYPLAAPEGFDSIESFNVAFLESLEKWHYNKTHPLNQSLRDGSQTPRDLTAIDDPVFNAFYRSVDIPIRQYIADVGNSADHPLTARNTGDYRIAGGWSVKLHGGGRHVNHVHPEGWISSSYYVSVPEETKTDLNKAGWIKFAEPPFETSPPSPPEKWIRPEAGMLVLFPSFLWHGTMPIHDGSVRVTAPFDAVPI
jgi:predicted Zn-dependent protease